MQSYEAGRLLRERAGGDVACAIVSGSGLAKTFRRHLGFEAVAYAELAALPMPRAKSHVGEALVGDSAANVS